MNDDPIVSRASGGSWMSQHSNTSGINMNTPPPGSAAYQTVSKDGKSAYESPPEKTYIKEGDPTIYNEDGSVSDHQTIPSSVTRTLEIDSDGDRFSKNKTTTDENGEIIASAAGAKAFANAALGSAGKPK